VVARSASTLPRPGQLERIALRPLQGCPLRTTRVTASITERYVAGSRTPATRTTMVSLAVKSFPGRAKLSRGKPPELKDEAFSGTAFESP
jgi:hypothetical protein